MAFANRLAAGEEPRDAARSMGHSGRWGDIMFSALCADLGAQAQ